MTITATPNQTRTTTQRSVRYEAKQAKKQIESLIVIDSAADHHQHLAEAIAQAGANGASATVVATVVIKPNQDGVQQILAAMHRFSTVTTIHVIANGGPGWLQLGNVQLNAATLDRYGWDLLTGFSEQTFSLYLYANHLAAAETGAEFIRRLHHFTGANIAASTQRITGIQSRLDYQIGQMDSALPVEPVPVATVPIEPVTV
jgi:hypothetical protein